jgi:hypothetical protein
MTSTYSTSLKLQLMGSGDNNTTWGNNNNTNLGTALEEAIVGSAAVTFASGTETLTLTNTPATQVARHIRLNLGGTSGGAQDLVVPTVEKIYIIDNNTADTITVKTAAGAGIAVPTTKTMWVCCDGTDVVDVMTHLTSLTLASALPVASGGTGAITAGAALTTLGAAALGANTDITSLDGTSGITMNSPTTGSFPGTAGHLNAKGLYIDGSPVGTSNAAGTVTSIDVSGGTTGLTTSGGAVTTSGTITLAGTLAVANGGTGSTTAGGARTNLGLGTMATQASSLVSISGGSISGISDLGVADGGTGASSASGARTNLGAAASGGNDDITSLNNSSGVFMSTASGAGQGIGTLNATGLFINGVAVGTGAGSVTSVNIDPGTTGLTFANGPISTDGTFDVAGTLAVANGGSGQTSYTNGQLLIGNTTGNTLAKATLTQGTGITITNSTGTITIDADNNGTVTSVNIDGGTTGLTFTGGPVTSLGTFTAGGTLALANGGTGADLSTTPGEDGILAWDETGAAVTYFTAGAGITFVGTTITASGATVGDADYGDVTVTSSGTVWTIDAGVVTYAKMQDTSGSDVILGQVSGGAAPIQEIPCTAAARSFLAETNSSGQRSSIGVGSISTQDSTAVTITGGAISGITDLAVADGGTGASTAGAALTNLGAAASGANADITGLSAVAAGSAAAPSITFTGDTDTGIYHPTADQWAVAVNASPRLAVTGGGVQVIGEMRSTTLRVTTPVVPASASDTGSAGTIAWDASYVYVCSATNTWLRAAIATW